VPDATSTPLDDATPAPSVVVTGAARWLGQNLVRALVPERSHARAIVRDNREAALLDVLGPNVQMIIGEMRDPDESTLVVDSTGRAGRRPR
jgi:uncharacterized protein YbjT (DUF2867 family)